MTNAGDRDGDNILSEDELSALTEAQLRSVAGELGIELTADDKAGMIAEILAAETEVEGTDLEDADADEDETVTREELEAMTVLQLRALAKTLEITLTANRKADIIDEILDGNESITISSGGGLPPGGNMPAN